jgi:hypothetical protein
MRLEDFHSLATAAITALDGSAYSRDPRGPGAPGYIAPAWHEAINPFTETEAQAEEAHLEFHIELNQSQKGEIRNSRGANVYMDIVLMVVFYYRLHPDAQMAGYREAIAAARDVVGVLVRPHQWAPQAGAMVVGNPERFNPAPSGTDLLLQARCSVSYSIPEEV